MSEELETRIAVLEVKNEIIETNLKETHTIVFQIKERLDKQNGLIPHMAEDIKAIKDHQSKLADEQTQIATDQVQDSTKLKIMWGILGVIGGSLGSIAIKLLISR